LLAIGGGSAFDAAKSISLLFNGINPIEKKGEGICLNGILTLSGSGTEVTPYSILTLNTGVKRSVVGRKFVDNCVIDKSYQQNIPTKYIATN
jgi:alcohol dehydrogenase class IV